MDNLCLMGLGLVGLLYLTSKKNKEIKNTEKNETQQDLLVIDNNSDKKTVTMAFMEHKYRNELEWTIPEEEFTCKPGMLAGFDYLKLSVEPNEAPIFGRYIRSFPQSLKTLLVKLEPSIVIGNTISPGRCGEWTLVTCSNKFPTISAITL